MNSLVFDIVLCVHRSFIIDTYLSIKDINKIKKRAINNVIFVFGISYIKADAAFDLALDLYNFDETGNHLFTEKNRQLRYSIITLPD